MPASGASTRRLAMRWSPSVQLSVKAGMSAALRLDDHLAAVALPDDAQSGEREQGVYLVDLLAVRNDHRRHATRSDGHGLVPELLADAAQDAADAAGEAGSDPGVDGGQRAVPARG